MFIYLTYGIHHSKLGDSFKSVENEYQSLLSIDK